MSSLKELRRDAKALGIKGYTKLSERELERAVTEAQSSFMKRLFRETKSVQQESQVKVETSVDAEAVAVEAEVKETATQAEVVTEATENNEKKTMRYAEVLSMWCDALEYLDDVRWELYKTLREEKYATVSQRKELEKLSAMADKLANVYEADGK